MDPALIDTDTLSEVMKGRDPQVREKARQYLATHRCFSFSIITRYEILRGLKVKRAIQQIAAFEARCGQSNVLPLTDEIIDLAAGLYADLYRRGQLISDADILVAATGLIHRLPVVTENPAHFNRIPGLRVESWRTG